MALARAPWRNVGERLGHAWRHAPARIRRLALLAIMTLTAYVLGKAEEARIEVLDDVDVVHVVRAHLAYFESIGAVGPSASSNDL